MVATLPVLLELAGHPDGPLAACAARCAATLTAMFPAQATNPMLASRGLALMGEPPPCFQLCEHTPPAHLLCICNEFGYLRRHAYSHVPGAADWPDAREQGPRPDG